VSLSVETATLDDSAAARVTLHKRWNLITNPFDKTILWSDVRAFNTRSSVGPIYSYSGTGGFVAATSLEPYAGYYYDNSDSSAYLSIPYGATSGVLKTDSVKAGEWTLNVEARSGEYSDRSMSLGTHVGARDGLDRYDYRKPRAMGNQLGVFFDRPDLDAEYSTFATDFRGPVEKAALWPFTLNAPMKNPVTLRFEGVGQIPDDFEVYIIDRTNARYADLRSNREYTLTPALATTSLTVAVGTHDALATTLSDVLPRTFGLDNNFPNPFNPSTTIPVALPVNADVTLRVYNILGEEIRTLVSGSLEAGRHWITWDGRNDAGRPVATGVYLVRLTGPQGVNVVKKMMLMK
jgi:hypothetical protein